MYMALYKCHNYYYYYYVVSTIGTIVFKRVECTSGNVKRLLQGSNH